MWELEGFEQTLGAAVATKVFYKFPFLLPDLQFLLFCWLISCIYSRLPDFNKSPFRDRVNESHQKVELKKLER